MKKTQALLILIILLAAFLRFWQIDSIPPGLHSDEADMGYAAYSILKTGLTAYGTFNPLAFPEFNGGTHPPLYTYILIPLTNFFGLNVIVERTPAIFFGVATTAVIYFLIKNLFRKDKVALLGAFLYAINPWSIFVSRQGLLESIAVFFVSLGIVLFLYAKKNPPFYILSAFSFGLSLHAYDAPKIFVALFVMLLIIFQWKSLLRVKKYFASFLIILGVFYAFVVIALFAVGQIADFNRITTFDKNEIEIKVNSERRITSAPLWASSFFHNKATVAFKTYASNFFRPFSTSWFFVDGHGDLLESVGRQGQFYMFEIPFFFIGLYVAIKKNKKIGFLLLSWLLIANIPGAITKGNFYPYRSILMLPVPILFSSLGIAWFWGWLQRKSILGKLIFSLSCFICSVFIFSFLFTYLYDYPVYGSESRFKERNQAINYAASLANKYDRVFLNGDVEWAVMYAFNAKTPPGVFQDAYKHKAKYKDVDVINIGKFSFGSFDIRKIATASAYFPKNSLVVVDADLLPDALLLKQFHGADPLRIIYKVIEVR